MSAQEKFPWTKFGFESVLIIVSILIAFSIEEWRQDREDAEQERALIEALEKDFDQAAQNFEQIRVAHTTVAEAGARIIQLADAGAVPDAEKAEFTEMVGWHFWRDTYIPPMGTVETILGSGRIDLIGNKQLVAELTRWSSVVDDLAMTESDANEHFYDRVYPYLSGQLNLKDLDKGYADFYAQIGEMPFEQRQLDASHLIEDREFINIVYTHWVLQTNALLQMENVEPSLNMIRALIAEELADVQ